ncbi:MAG: type II toxin-antitoxin system HicA family toxin [Dehalococcoidia bacterium]
MRALEKAGFDSRELAEVTSTFAATLMRDASPFRHSGKDVPVGTLSAILRDADLTGDQLRALL